jgi:hypothetical protein
MMKGNGQMRYVFYGVVGALVLVSCLLVVLSPKMVLAQDVTTETVAVAIDGITRTVTVRFTVSGVVDVDVAPLTSTFQTTATAWLSGLWAAYDGVAPGTEIDLRQRYSETQALLDQTVTTTYPVHFTPFVRQYRFAIHTCADYIGLVAGMQEDPEGLNIFAVAPYLTMKAACVEQYQDAYVEMERTLVGW